MVSSNSTLTLVKIMESAVGNGFDTLILFLILIAETALAEALETVTGSVLSKLKVKRREKRNVCFFSKTNFV